MGTWCDTSHRYGEPDSASADVVVLADYEVGMQDQLSWARSRAWRCRRRRWRDLYIATQWLHADQAQIAP